MGATTRAVGGAALLALVAGGLFLQGLGRYPLLDPDEARHAEVAREMAAGHGLRRLFLTTLDLEPYPEKPAGYYWLVALAYAALGVNEAAARAVSALAALVARPRPRLGELGLERGMLTVVALGALLWVPVGLLDPSYLSAFAVTNVRRLGSASPHAGPIYYYLLWVPALLFPWTLFAVGPLRRAARDPRRRTLVLWAVFVPTVLTLARGKLATYALSALAPLALVVGTELASGSPAEDRTTLRAGGARAALALLVGAGAALFAARGYLALSARVLLAAAALGWAVGLLLVLRRARLHLLPAAVLGAALTLYPLAVREVAPAVAALHSDREAARLIAGVGTAPVVAFAIHDPSLTFYLCAPVIHTDDTKLVRDLFAGDGLAFLVTGPRHFAQVEQLLGAQANLWLETPRRRLYANRPSNGST